VVLEVRHPSLTQQGRLTGFTQRGKEAMSDPNGWRDLPGLESLGHPLLTDDADLSDALRRVAESGAGLMANCTSASVTLIEHGRAVTVGSTSGMAQALDDAQYAAGDGPCLTAAREGMVVRLDDIAADGRWLSYAQRALEQGVRSSLSTPLDLAGDNTWGGFNAYSAVPAGFSDEDEQLCRAFAIQASIIVSNVQAYWASLELSNHLSRAMESRAVIEQAKGVLMANHHVDADRAFDLLVERSQAENRKLREVAGDVVRGILGGDNA
jgi:GAF domain-containing protein